VRCDLPALANRIRDLIKRPSCSIKKYRRYDPYPFPFASFLGVGRRNAIIKPKTYFKQVPLKFVKKIVKQQTEQEEVAVLPTSAAKKKLKLSLVEAITVIRE
jgi:hypothetical protein